MLKMRIFWKKGCKIASASRDPPPNPPWPPTAVAWLMTPAYYYNLVEFVSSAKCVLLPSKKNYRKCSAFASSALLHLF